MKVLIIGQCQGGNAKTWQDFLSAYSEFELIHYVCRNQCQDDFFLKGEGKKVFRFYNKFQGMGILRKIWVKLVSTRLLPAFVKRMDQKFHYDIIHFQGNYEPEFNLKLMNATKAKAVVSIYGSDFYQRYLNAGASGRKSFEKVIDRAAHILFNFEMTRTDFLKEIDVKDKSSVGCMGVSDFWEEPVAKSTGAPAGVTRLLSARGMYAYNNVDLLVDAFIELYANNPSYELYLINGYGWDEQVKDAILEKVKGIENIHAIVGRWITDEELKGYYALCDYNFCIGNTDQLSVSIIYGFMNGCINILSPIDNYKELYRLGFKSHYTLNEVNENSMRNVLKDLPEFSGNILDADFALAKRSFLFSERFKNTFNVFDSLTNH